MLFEDRVIVHIERKYFAILDKISDLPANAAIVFQNPAELRNRLRLRLQIIFNRDSRFVTFYRGYKAAK